MTGSRSLSAARNMGAALGLQIVTVSLGFILRATFARSLGADMVGLNAVLADMLALLSMAELGLSTAMIFSYLQPISNGNAAKLAVLQNYYRKLYRYVSIGIALVGLAGLPLVRLLVRLDPVPTDLELYYVLLLANTALTYSCTHLVALVTAYQQAYLIMRARLWAYLVQVSLQIGALLLMQSYLWYLIAQLVATVVLNVLIVRRAHPFRPESQLESHVLSVQDRSLVRDLFTSMGVYKAAVLAFSASTTLIISIIFGTATVGVYAGYAMLVASISGVINSGFASATAGLGDAMLTETAHRRSELFGAVQTLAFMLSVPVTVVFVFSAGSFVGVWLGPEFQLDDASLVALAAGLYLTIVLQPVWIFREATGMYRRTKWLMVAAAVGNISFAILLANVIGLVGVFIAPIAARLLTYFAYEPLVLFREFFEAPVKGYFLPVLYNTLLVTGFVSILRLGGVEPGPDWGSLIATTGALLAVSGAVSLLVYHRSSGFRVLRQILRNAAS